MFEYITISHRYAYSSSRAYITSLKISEMWAGFGAYVEAPFAFLDEQMEMLAGDAIVAAQVALGLVPEILDSAPVHY